MKINFWKKEVNKSILTNKTGAERERNCSPKQFQDRCATELGMDFPGIIWGWGWQVQHEEVRPEVQELY